MGEKIRDMGYEPGVQPEADYIAIKMPVFSFEKLRGADIAMGPEMKSTGECLGIATTFQEALHKAFMGAGVNLPKYKRMIMTIADGSKEEAVEVGRRFHNLGYDIYATRGTARVLNEAGVPAFKVNRLDQDSPTVMDLLLDHHIDLVIDMPTDTSGHSRNDGFQIRRTAIETGVNVITALDTANALAMSLENGEDSMTLIDIATIGTR
jgi:carbamoyl-phosphate synthase large subunit